MSMNKRVLGVIFFLCLLYIPSVFAESPNANNSITNITDKLDTSINQPINLPSPIESVVKIILGIKKSPQITLTLLVSMTCIWFFLFIILAETLNLTPFFSNTTRWIGAAIITLLIAATGIIETIYLWIFSPISNIGFIKNWSTGALIFLVVLIVICGFILTKILKFAKEYNERIQMHQDGTKVGVELGFLARMRDMFKFTKDI